MRKVLIMLSTYNGEKYLSEQLDSLYAQESVEIHILVRDDGSKDTTLKLLQKYKDEKGRMTILNEPNIGVSRSFYRLMQYAFYEMASFDYYSFCDQDDVWFQHKLEISCRHLEARSDQPQLFYAPAIPVDANLSPLKPSTARAVNCLGANIASNHSLGCMQVYNRALLQKSVRICEYIEKHTGVRTYYPLHDAWNALVAYTFGKVVIGEAPLMFYRQHGQNVVGSGQEGIAKLVARTKRYIKSDRRKSEKCRILLDIFEEELPDEKLRLIKLCANYGNSFFKRVKLAFTKDIYHYGIADNLCIFIVVILNQF